MKLPFIEESKWPISKEPEERVVNPSYDAKIQDHLVDELLVALEHKDKAEIRESMVALIHSIFDEETES